MQIIVINKITQKEATS